MPEDPGTTPACLRSALPWRSNRAPRNREGDRRHGGRQLWQQPAHRRRGVEDTAIPAERARRVDILRLVVDKPEARRRDVAEFLAQPIVEEIVDGWVGFRDAGHLRDHHQGWVAGEFVQLRRLRADLEPRRRGDVVADDADDDAGVNGRGTGEATLAAEAPLPGGGAAGHMRADKEAGV